MKKLEIAKLEYEKQFREEEAYRTLRTNLEFSGKHIKVITVTSCVPGEGKTTVCMKLAEVIAETGKKVIVVDADLRKSVMIGRFKSKPVLGLSNYLCGNYSLDEVICETQVENMHVLFSGQLPPNPSELLTSNEFGELVSQLREIYDYVIIDSPPLGAVIDTAIISKVCDGAIFVIEANKISAKIASKVIAQLRMSNCRILGCVLNKVEKKTKGYYKEYVSNSYENDAKEEKVVKLK